MRVSIVDQRGEHHLRMRVGRPAPCCGCARQAAPAGRSRPRPAAACASKRRPATACCAGPMRGRRRASARPARPHAPVPPGLAVPSAAACFIVLHGDRSPSGPLARTAARCRRSACARAISAHRRRRQRRHSRPPSRPPGMYTAAAATCIAPTTVPASWLVSPLPSAGEAARASAAAGRGRAAVAAAWPALPRCGRLGHRPSNSREHAAGHDLSPAAPPGFRVPCR